MSPVHNRETPSQIRSERMLRLLQLVSDRGEVHLRDLTDELDASAATIRRDVSALAAQGLLVRTHGGAKALPSRHELPTSLRDGHNQEAKRAIAQAAVAALPGGQHSIALSGGTTTLEVMRALEHRQDLTIITNSVALGVEAAQHDRHRVLIAGGVLRPASMELVGSLTDCTFRQVHVGTAILGCDGATAENGITTHDQVEASTNLVMMQQANRVICVADGSKIGTTTQAQMADMSMVDLLITDVSADPVELGRIRAQGVTVKVVTLP